MKSLNIGSIKIPATAATKAFAVLAKRGAGKTYTAAVMAEGFHAAGIPFVVFDPIDVWWGLRLKADGKAKGLPVVVFGLEHADIQINKDMGRRIAQAIVKDNISCVISTFGMGKQAMRHLVAEFADELLKINNTPRHVFIEEAHEFVPQRVMGDAGKCFAAVEALVVMGRNRGIGVTLINQRAATINKDVLTQVDVLLAMRSVGPQDRKALKEWVKFHAAEGDFDAFLTSLPSLPTGEGWLWSPEFMDGVFERIQIRKRETFHVDREKLGTNFTIPKLSQTDIASFVSSFAVKPEPVKAAVAVAKLDPAVEKSYKDKIKTLEQSVSSYQAQIKKMIGHAELLIKVGQAFFGVDLGSERGSESVFLSRTVFKEPIAVNKDTVVSIKSGDANPTVLGKCERKIYTFLFQNQHQSFSKVQLGAVTGYSPKSGGFNNAISKLSTLGLISRDGGHMKLARATEEDQEYLLDVQEDGGFSASPVYWSDKLGKCEREVYSYLWNVNRTVSKFELADATNYSGTSGGFNNALSRLASLGLILRTSDGLLVNPAIRDL